MPSPDYRLDLGFGRAQIFPETNYSALERFMQLGKVPESVSSKEKAQFFKDQASLKIDELEAWEDTKSFEEISKAQDSLKNVWKEAYARGINIGNPRNQQEADLQKQFQGALSKVQESSTLYKRQGERYKSLQQFADQHSDEIDFEGTMKNLDEYKNVGNVFDRAKAFNNVIVYKKPPFDVSKYVVDNLPKYVSVSKETTSDMYDPYSGKIKKSTWEGIPEEDREKALGDMYKFGPEGLKDNIKIIRESDINDDKNKSDQQYFVDEFSNVKSGGKVEDTYYALGEEATGQYTGIGINLSGMPTQDKDGNYLPNTDVVSIYDNNKFRVSAYTSPYVVNMQGIFKETPSSALSIDMTPEIRNTQTGQPEPEGGVYSILPTKIFWAPVAEQDINLGKSGGSWIAPMRAPIRQGSMLSDEDLALVQQMNDKMVGSGTYYKYTWKPYIMGRTKYGQVETQDDISTFNRSDYAPLESIQDDIKAKIGPNKWKNYQQGIDSITNQMNEGNVPDNESLMNFTETGL